jgi:hypothetical protein
MPFRVSDGELVEVSDQFAAVADTGCNRLLVTIEMALRRALGRVESDRNRYAGIDSGKFGAQARR